MRIVITGASGFIGSATLRELDKRGYKTCNYDIQTGCDLLDLGCLLSVIQEGDYVLHEAAIARFADADKNPKLAFQVNVLGTQNVVKACNYNKAGKLVYASTGSVYMPIDGEMPITENFRVSGNSVYACSKRMAENIIEQDCNIPWIILRYAHLYGEGKIGHGAIGGFVDRMQKGESPVIFGGKQSNDFCVTGDTLVLTSNLEWIPINKIKVGDKVIAFDEKPIGKKRFLRYGVIKAVTSYISDNVFNLKTQLSTVRATSNHPWFTDKAKFRKTTSLLFGQSIRTFSQPFEKVIETDSYKKGYLLAAIDGDGCRGIYNSKGNDVYRIAISVVSQEFRDTVSRYWLDIGLKPRLFSGQPKYPGSQRNYGAILNKKVDYLDFINIPYMFEDMEFCRGYMAGLYDAEGESMAKKNHLIALSNKDPEIINRAKLILDKYGFQYSIHPKKIHMQIIQIRGGLNEHIRFFATFQPKITAKRPNLNNRELKGGLTKVTDITKSPSMEVYNLVVGDSETYIANGLLCHNTYVGDIVQANVKALFCQPNALREIFNIGTGLELSTEGVFDILADYFNYHKEYERKPLRSVDPPRFVFDITKARKLLGYEPEYPFEQGIKKWFGERR